MIQRRSILALILCATVAFPAAAASGSYAITTQRVAAAMSSFGVQISPEQIILPAKLVAKVADPELKVKSLDRAADQRAFARIECVNPEQCIPFVVTLQLHQQMIANPGAESSPERTAANNESRPPAPLVRAGSHATLLLEGTHVHIRLSVISIENGGIGQTIRVTSLDRRQVYSAQVVREGVLEGRL